MSNEYTVRRASGTVKIDGDWTKQCWAGVDAIEIANVLGETCGHIPRTQVKLCYDNERLYVIFRVQDRYVRAVTTEMHGPVWEDSCVEFFFTPLGKRCGRYFNLETNCCGAMLMQTHTGPRENSQFVETDKCEKIEIATSISGAVNDEIDEPLVWTLEYGLPFEMFSDFEGFAKPAGGVKWYGNFYKCADKSSHPHWMTWTPISIDPPDFHLPKFFGVLNFEFSDRSS